MARHLLSDAQRKAVLEAHFHLSESDRYRYWTLSADDLYWIGHRRRDENRLGFAVQLCLLRFPGWPLRNSDSVPKDLLQFVVAQLQLAPGAIDDFYRRQQTRSEHLQEIQDLFGFTSWSLLEQATLGDFLFPVAMRSDDGMRLMIAALDELRRRRVVLPALSTLEYVVWTVQDRAEKEVYQRLASPLGALRRNEMDQLLLPDEEVPGNLTWLRQAPGVPSAGSMIEALDRLDLARRFEVAWPHPDQIHRDRIVALARRADRHTLQHLREYPESKRFAIVTAFLLRRQEEITDDIVDMHLSLLGQSFNRAGHRLLGKFQDNGRQINSKLYEYRDLGAALIAAKRKRLSLVKAVEQAVGWDELIASVDEIPSLVASPEFSNIEELASRYSYLRQYVPRLLRSFEFGGADCARHLLKAMALLRELDDAQKRDLPEEAPRAFIRPKWRPFVIVDDKLDRTHYELCVLSELALGLRAGDIWIRGSQRYRPFEEYLLERKEWVALRQAAPADVPHQTARQFLQVRESEIHQQLEQTAEALQAGRLTDVRWEKGRLRITPLSAQAPAEAEWWSNRLYALLPRLSLTDLLVEVDCWVDFGRCFTHIFNGKHAQDWAHLFAVIVSDATNLGLTKMADATPGMTYHQLSRVADWHVNEANYAKGLAQIVDRQHREPLAKRWGSGLTASSDGQAFPIATRQPVLGARNAKYGPDPVVMLYTHISDRYAPFHTKVIRATARDATYVLDGLLFEGGKMGIKEHYTDTAGFTDHVFALCSLLGFRFAPRIKDLGDRRLYTLGTLGTAKLSGPLAELIGGAVQARVIRNHWDEVQRLVDSIREGRVNASLLIAKLAAYPRQHQLALALREIGRVERTLFILDWLQQPELRRRAHEGLNKGELRNSLARALRFYRRGSVSDRSHHEQERCAGGLNLVVAAITLWNTVYLNRALEALVKIGQPVPDHIIPHVSPIGWEHITLTGQYVWRPFALRSTSGFRALRDPQPIRRRGRDRPTP